ncbi:MAG: hypothetical protein JWP11_845 [Frankiales bacterium]|nr:hypothetical protein [Frankiales bacterium]
MRPATVGAVRPTRFVNLLILLVLLPACTGGTVTAQPTLPQSPSPASPARSTAIPWVSSGQSLALATAGKMLGTWQLAMTIGYGSRPSQLGLAGAHGGKSPPSGPASAAPAADGTWWFLDSSKHRLAHFSGSGTYLGAVPIPGGAIPAQFLHVFEGGSILAPFGSAKADTVVSDGTTARRVALPGSEGRAWTYDDGQRAYARRAASGPVATVEVVDGRPLVGTTDWFRTHHGERFSVSISDLRLLVELPDALPPTRLTFPLSSAEHPKARVLAGVEYVTDADGTLHLLVYGSTDEGPHTLVLASYLAIDRKANVSSVDRMPSMQSHVDSGSPSHLHIQPGTTMPSLVLESDDALRVYTQRSRFYDCNSLKPGDRLDLDNVGRCDPGSTQPQRMTCNAGEYVRLDRPGALDDIEGIFGLTPRWRRAKPIDPRYGRTQWAFQHCQEQN